MSGHTAVAGPIQQPTKESLGFSEEESGLMEENPRLARQDTRVRRKVLPS